MDLNLTYGSRTIQVHVAFGRRKRLTISVHPDCSVTAKAPLDTPTEKIENRLKRRSEWIAKQLAFFENHHPTLPPRQYISGETHYYLGRQYRLRIRTGETARVRLIGGFFEVDISDATNIRRIADLMKKWYSCHAKELMLKRIAMFWSTFQRMGAKEPRVVFRRTAKRWGSCNNGQRILLNTDLIKTPLHCIDYVIVHELCHLLCPRHDPQFYRLLKRVMPDRESRKDRLENAMF